MSTDREDREAWVRALAKDYFRDMEGRDAMNVYEMLAKIAAARAERLARQTEARTLNSMMELAGRLAAAMASEDAEAIEGVDNEFRVSIDIPKAALPWRAAMETE